MRKDGLLLSLAGIGAAASIILSNPVAAVASVAVMAYYSLVKFGFRGDTIVELSLPKTAFEEEPVKARFTVRSPVDGTVEVSPRGDDFTGVPVRAEVRAGTPRTFSQTVVPLRRGSLRPSFRVHVEDSTGLVSKDLIVSGGEITVFPSPRSVAAGMRARQVNMLSEVSKLLGMGTETLEFDELREFREGDNSRRIDWKATSRLQKFVVRVFKRESLPEVYLLLNVDERFRRELSNCKGRVDYLVLILSQLIKYFSAGGGKVFVIAYDENGVRKVIPGDSPSAVVASLGLSRVEGIPPLTPQEMSVETPPSGLVEAARKVPSGSYVVVIDDIALHPVDFVRAGRMFSRRGSFSVFLYPNPILFMGIDPADRELLVSLYRGYRERKELMKRLMSNVKLLEVGPNDLLPEIKRRL